ncbi:MAG: polyketide antibiotic transporter, partial [Gaiellales bacterium]
IRTGSFAVLFLFIAYANVEGYRRAYPTLADREQFARSFGNDRTLRLFYGVPHDLASVTGYVGWRVGGSGAIVAAAWGILAAVRAFRAEEESGRMELVLAGAVTRARLQLALLTAIAIDAVVLWAVIVIGRVAGRLPVGGSVYLALAILSAAAVFAGVGARASQIAPTRRLALTGSMVVLIVALLLRVAADTASGVEWLRWTTPLGWSEELQPFADPRPAVLILPALATAGLLAAATAIGLRRDIGSGLVRARDTAPPDLRLLSSPTAETLRSERAPVIVWLVATGFFALVMGILSDSFTASSIPENLQQQLKKFGGASITTPSGALGFYFLFGVLAFALFACAQIAAARREESDQRLETLFALPVGRLGWLAGRIGLALSGIVALALVAGVLAWAGAASQGAAVGFPQMLGAGLNCVPVAVLFLGLAALAYGAWPRGSTGVGYGLVGAAFVWYLVGSLIDVPGWALGISPFRHIGFVPGQAFQVVDAAVMLGVGVAAAALAGWLFRRRDLIGA